MSFFIMSTPPDPHVHVRRCGACTSRHRDATRNYLPPDVKGLAFRGKAKSPRAGKRAGSNIRGRESEPHLVRYFVRYRSAYNRAPYPPCASPPGRPRRSGRTALPPPGHRSPWRRRGAGDWWRRGPIPPGSSPAPRSRRCWHGSPPERAVKFLETASTFSVPCGMIRISTAGTLRRTYALRNGKGDHVI